jgi:hypothetical protein
MSNTSPAPRWQFSLRGLLIAVAVVAVVLGLGSFTIGQGLLGLLIAISLRGVIPTMAVVAAFYGRGDVRVFAMGAVVASVPLLTSELGSTSFPALVAGTIAHLMAMGLCGAAAVATRRWLIRQGMSDDK